MLNDAFKPAITFLLMYQKLVLFQAQFLYRRVNLSIQYSSSKGKEILRIFFRNLHFYLNFFYLQW
jgi:hypothetical protein